MSPPVQRVKTRSLSRSADQAMGIPYSLLYFRHTVQACKKLGYICVCVVGQRIWLTLDKYRKKIFQRLKQELVYGCLRAAVQGNDEEMSEQREVLQVWHRTTKCSNGKNTKDTNEILGLTNESPSLLEKNPNR